MRGIGTIATVLACSLVVASTNAQTPSLGVAATPKPMLEGPASLLPQGTVRLVLERMTPEDRDDVLRAASEDLRSIEAEYSTGALTASQAAEKVDGALGLRVALLIAARDPALQRFVRPRLNYSADALNAAAQSSEIDLTWRGRKLSDAELKSYSAQLLVASPYIHGPLTPRGEDLPSRTNRLDAIVSRAQFRAVVGIGKRGVSGEVELYCSGILLSSTAVLTAGHCVKGPDAPARDSDILVLVHFNGGADEARRIADGRRFRRISLHPISGAKVHDDVAQSSSGSWSHDVAILNLSSPISAPILPARASQFPIPVALTAAGWGLSDATPVGDIALEITPIRLRAGVSLEPTPPSLVAWPVSMLISSGRVCRGDSGGPVFSGVPDNTGAMDLRLVGLVSSGNRDCGAGRQYITDMTTTEMQSFVCRNASGTRYCR